jgi:multiple sugar transport system permease protein
VTGWYRLRAGWGLLSRRRIHKRGVEVATRAVKRRRLFKFGNRGGLAGYLFVAPSIVFLLVFVILPIFLAFYYSLTDYDLMRSPRFAGFKNYLNLFDDVRYPRGVANTLYFAAATVPGGVVTSLLLAMLVNRQIRGIYTFRALFYLPVVSSFVSVSLIWLWMYEPQFGLLNDGFEALGLPRLKWLRSAQTAMLGIIIMSVWKNMGLNMVIYLAGLQGIPPHLYEAAEIDGAGRVSTFFRITLPLLAPTTFFVVIVYFIGAMQMFVQVFVMTSSTGVGSNETYGGPLDSTITVVTLIYSNAFHYLKMGYAAAMSFVLFLVISVITVINARLLRYDVGY